MTFHVEVAKNSLFPVPIRCVSHKAIVVLFKAFDMFGTISHKLASIIALQDTMSLQEIDILVQQTSKSYGIDTVWCSYDKKRRAVDMCTYPFQSIVYWPKYMSQYRVLTTNTRHMYDYDVSESLWIAAITDSWEPQFRKEDWFEECFRDIDDQAEMRGHGLAQDLLQKYNKKWVCVIAFRENRKPLCHRIKRQ